MNRGVEFLQRQSGWNCERSHTVIGIESYSREQQRAVKRVLSRLAQLEKMESRRHEDKRQFARSSYHSSAVLCIGSNDQPSPAGLPGESCTVWTRDLSRGGASFICPFAIRGKRVFLGFKLPDETIKWYPAEIVREREIAEEGFWEYGTVFRSALPETTPDATTPVATPELSQP
jgi:hypothetical protein